MSRFLERLAQETPIVADGGMGALLSSAVAGLRCPEEANLRAPESVLEVHLGYIRAGAELIETNSFGANRAKLARQFLGDELEQINAAAVRIAREAREVAGRDVFTELINFPSRRACSRGAASTCSWSRRSTTSTS